MASKKNNNSNNKTKKITQTNSKNISKTKKTNQTAIKNKKVEENKNIKKNTMIMKVLVFLGVLIFSFIIVYLMYHFFVEKNNIKINISTDKKMEYININGKEELIVTQKYVSDLAYNMRYDINDFKVFKYKEQDIFKNLNDERILVVVEKSYRPSNCSESTIDTEYNNCYVKVDDYTEEYYISTSKIVYKVTIKTPGINEYDIKTKMSINFMLNNFKITN